MDVANAGLSVLVKKTRESARLPVYASAGAAGCDLMACISKDVVIHKGERALIPTGLAFAIPECYEMQLRPRSGLALKQGISLANTPATIDSDYRGEVGIILINHGNESFTVKDGDRIAQLIIAPVVRARFRLSEDLDSTVRGQGGFGSTGI